MKCRKTGVMALFFVEDSHLSFSGIILESGEQLLSDREFAEGQTWTNNFKQASKRRFKHVALLSYGVNDQKEWLGECHQSTLVERGHFQVLEQLLQNMPQNFSWHSVASAMACVVCLCGYANASASGLALLYLLVAMTICSSFQISAHLSQKRRTWLKITLARSLLGEMEG